MCDVSKYTQVYEDMKKLKPDEFLQLITESETQEERFFWSYMELYSSRKTKKGYWKEPFLKFKVSNL